MRIKKSYQLFGFPQQYSIQKCLDVAKQAGYDAIEINVENNGEITIDTPKEKFVEINKYAKSIGMEVNSIASSAYWANPITSNIKERAAKAEKIVMKMIEAAEYLESKVILIVPGVVHTDLKDIAPDPERMPYDEVHARAIKKINEYGKICMEKNITIGIENVFWNKFLLSPFDFINFIDEVNMENVKIYFDVGNCIMCGIPEHWIKMFGKKRICSIHLKDLDINISNFNGFKALLNGSVNWPEVVNSLSAIEYEGYVTYEGFGSYNFFPEEQVFNSSRAIDKIFGLNK